MQQRMSISGKSQSTLKNYSHHVAKMALHFGLLPTKLDEDQINDYLHLMQQEHKTPSESYFKFTVYGLRYAFRISGLQEARVALPRRSPPAVPGRNAPQGQRRRVHRPGVLHGPPP